jgi:hypothetical protein
MPIRTPRRSGASPPPPPENEKAEIQAMLRRLEELRRTASNSELRRAYQAAIDSLDGVIYRLAMLRAPGPAATRAPLTAGPAAPRAAAARIGAVRKPRR